MRLTELLRELADRIDGGEVAACHVEGGGVAEGIDNNFVTRNDTGLRGLCVVWSEADLPGDAGDRLAAGLSAVLGDDLCGAVSRAATK